MINLDANSTYGLLDIDFSVLKDLGNPSSIHKMGQDARALIEDARNLIKNRLSISDHYRIIFTSGASEANNQALFYPVYKAIEKKNHHSKNIVISAFEHPSVLETVRQIEKFGVEVRIVKPIDGRYDSECFLKEVDRDTLILSVMAANNETGYILPVKEIFSFAKEKFPYLLCHSDTVQVAGKIYFDFEGGDFYTLSGHKLGALSGIGCLIARDSLGARPFIYGGPQESRWRAGTENIAGIYSFAKAIEYHYQGLDSKIQNLSRIKEEILSFLKDIPEISINYENEACLPNTLSCQINGVRADDLVVAMDLAGVAISSGSACASGKPLPSHVLLAMGKGEEEAKSTIRLSFRSDLKRKDIEFFYNKFSENVRRVKDGLR